MIIPPNVFKLAKLASTESTRYAINGMNFERADGQCHAVTTDGRRLAIATWDDRPTAKEFPAIAGEPDALEAKDGFSTILSLSHCKDAEKAIPTKMARHKPILAHAVLNEATANGTVTMVTTDLERTQRMTAVPNDGCFPKWRDVVPNYKLGVDSASISVSPKLLREILDVAEHFTDEEHKGVLLEIPLAACRPLVVTPASIPGQPKARFVLMPVSDPNASCHKENGVPIPYPTARIQEMLDLLWRAGHVLERVGPVSEASTYRDWIAVLDDLRVFAKSLSSDFTSGPFQPNPEVVKEPAKGAILVDEPGPRVQPSDPIRDPSEFKDDEHLTAEQKADIANNYGQSPGAAIAAPEVKPTRKAKAIKPATMDDVDVKPTRKIKVAKLRTAWKELCPASQGRCGCAANIFRVDPKEVWTLFADKSLYCCRCAG